MARTPKLQIVISALDKASKQFNTIAGKFNKFGDNLTKAGKKMSIGVTLPLLAVGGGLLKLASDAEETQSKFEAVFKEQAKDAEKWAKEFGKSIGRSETDLKGYAATLQDTFVPLGFAREKAADFSKSLVELAVDLASFNNLAEDDVIRDLQSAMVGNTETLRKYGVVASQAAIEQEAINSGLVKNKNEIDAAVKSQAILQLTLKGTTDAQGDALRTAGGFANQMRALKSEAKGLGEQLGKQIIPVALKVVDAIKGMVRWFSNLSEGQQKTILIIGGVVAALGPLLMVLGNITKAVGLLSKGFALMMAHPVAAFVTAVVAALAIATDGFGLFSSSVKGAGTQTASFNKQMEILNKTLGDSAAKALKSAAKALEELADAQGSFFGRDFEEKAIKASESVENLKDEIREAAKAFGASDAVTESYIENINQVALAMADGEASAIDLQQVVSSASQEMESSFTSLSSEAREKFNNILTAQEQVNFNDAIAETEKWLGKNKEAMDRIVLDIIETETEMGNAGKAIMTAMGKGLSAPETLKVMKDSTGVINNQILTDLQTGADTSTRAFIEEMKGSLNSGGEEMASTTAAVGVKLMDSLKGAMQSKTSSISAVWKSLKGVFTPIQAVIEVIQRFVGGRSKGGGGVEARADGGPVQANKPFLVGEEGPELFIPKGNGTIIPNDKMGGSPSSINISVFQGANVSVSGEADEDRLAQKVSQVIARETELIKQNALTAPA